MKPTKKLKTALLVASVCCSTQAIAEVQFNGFASIKAGVLFDDAVDLNGNGNIDVVEQAYFGVYDKDLSFKPESLFALQVYSDLGEGLSVTAQLFAEGKDNFDVEARWAYVSYQISDSWKVNVGRMVLPMFYKSEFQDVGYAVNQNRLPVSVYGNFDFNVVEGIRIDNSTELGDWSVNSSFGYSSWDGEVVVSSLGGAFPGSFSKTISANTEFSWEWLTLFAGGFIAEVDFSAIDNAALFPQVDAAAGAYGFSAAETANLKQAVQFSGDGQYYYLGGSIDYNDWLLTVEYADYGVKDSGDTFNEVYYVTVGKRINEYTILYTYEDYDQPVDLSTLDGFTPAAKQVGSGLKQALAAATFSAQTISLRYDFHSNAAFKADVFSVEPLNMGESIMGMSIGIDLVF
jgi:hypothetical protein